MPRTLKNPQRPPGSQSKSQAVPRDLVISAQLASLLKLLETQHARVCDLLEALISAERQTAEGVVALRIQMLEVRALVLKHEAALQALMAQDIEGAGGSSGPSAARASPDSAASS